MSLLLLSTLSLALTQPPADPPAPDQPQPAEPALPDPPPPAPAPDRLPLVTDPEPETVVILRDGQRYTGFLVEQTPARVVLKIAGINTTIKSSLIDRVEVLPPVLERYRLMRALIDDTDTERLLLLAEWLRVRDEFDAALTEIGQALAVQPDHPDALRLRLLVQSQKELAERPPAPRPAPGERPPAPGAPPGEPDFPLLSPEDINTIKVFEVDLEDPPRLVIRRGTIDELLARYKGDRRLPQSPEEQQALYRASPTRILDLMFRLRARELYPQVQVVDLPHSLRAFRDDVHRTWLINACATTNCHGGKEAGRLRLYTKRPNTEETVFTNFIILERYKLPDGTPLINYAQPAESPLLQMGLPTNVSTYPHPFVPGREGRGNLWRPFFHDTDDLRFEEAVEWIQSMYRPRPEYPIEYTPPTPEAIAPPPDAPPIER